MQNNHIIYQLSYYLANNLVHKFVSIGFLICLCKHGLSKALAWKAADKIDKISLAYPRQSYPTNPFTILESQDQVDGEFYSVQEHRTTEAPKLGKGSSGSGWGNAAKQQHLTKKSKERKRKRKRKSIPKKLNRFSPNTKHNSADSDTYSEKA